MAKEVTRSQTKAAGRNALSCSSQKYTHEHNVERMGVMLYQ